MTQARPLAGLRVVITRAARQADALSGAFAEAGAKVALLPLLAVAPPADPVPIDAALRDIEVYDHLVFASPNAVRAVLPRLSGNAPAIAVIGPATAAAVRNAGFRVAREARRRHGRGLAQALASEVAGRRILLPQAADARPELAAGLEAAGARVDAVVAYAKTLPAGADRRCHELFDDQSLGWVTFTSPRVVRHFIGLLGDRWSARRQELRAVAIGPTTRALLLRREVDTVTAREPTPGAMVTAVIEAVS